MRRVGEYPLWVGNARDARDIGAVLDAGIEAVVDLAVDEPPVRPTRELVYLRFPLVDGGGNPPWLLRAAVAALEPLVRLGVPTLVACGGGMSRSLAVAAAAVSLAGRTRGLSADGVLAMVREGGPADLHPELWHAVTGHALGPAEVRYEPRE
jgi:hypothetical protein